MSSFAIRPHFTQTLDFELEEAQARIIEEVERGEDRCEVKNFPGFVCLRIPEQDRHFWSPRLTLSFEREEDGTTRIEGIYGPNANVWSLILYGYFFAGSAGVFAGSLGVAQWTLDRTPWGLWIAGAMAAVMIAIYVSAQFGQKLGAVQTFRLHQIYESAMGRTVDIH